LQTMITIIIIIIIKKLNKTEFVTQLRLDSRIAELILKVQ